MNISQTSVRADLLNCYQAALQAVHGHRCVVDYFSHQTERLDGKLAMVAIGKAAVAMADGALAVFPTQIGRGLVITKSGYAGGGLPDYPLIELIESAHPIPDARSLAAGSRLLAFLASLPPDIPVLFLISGGASALVEVLPEGLGLVDLQAVNTAMLAAGLSIEEMNRIRREISQIKGGRLIGSLGGRKVLNLLLSDVPGNDPAVIGSGLLVGTAQPTDLPQNLPEVVLSTLARTQKSTPVTQQAADIRTAILGDNQTAQQAAAVAARARGYEVHLYPVLLTGDLNAVADEIFTRLITGRPGIHIWGGETTVCLPTPAGRGGRNQHLALLLANRIRQMENLHILVAATDGSDGPTEDAGGLVDAYTVQRGEQEGFDVRACLAAADAGSFLEASGDLLSTGPTGSNVMDLIIACKT